MRGRGGIAAVLSAALVSIGLALPAPAGAAIGRAELALRWAPIHYQDVDATGSHALGGRADYLTRVDFDGDWLGRNNWDRAAQSDASFSAAAYYSVVETGTHWFITYFFFHPRDWVDHPFFETEHENDGEGVLLAVQKDGSPYGVLRSAVTVAHTNFYSYTPSGSTWTGGRETVDGTLVLQSSPYDSFEHPVTAQQVQGHGLKAYPQYKINGDGVVYYPSTRGGTPSSTDDRNVPYELIDVFASGGLWAQRDTTSLFAGLGTFAGDKSGGCGVGTYACGVNSANAPWGWDDGNDLPGRGEIATDPAKLSAEYFTVPEELARSYAYNPYQAEAADLRRAAETAPPITD
jgi:hypothetical protein